MTKYKKSIETGSKILGALVLAKAGKPKIAAKFLTDLKGSNEVDDFIASLTSVIKMLSEGVDLEEIPEAESMSDEDEDEDEDEDDDEIMDDSTSEEDEDEDEDDEDLSSIVDDMEEDETISEATASILRNIKY